MSCGIRAVELEHRKGTAGLAGARVANLSLHQKKPDLVPKKARKSQIAVLRHIHMKHTNQTQNTH